MPNLLDIYWWKHYVYGLLEVDVTIARRFIPEFKARTGEALSFTGYLVFCLARVIDEDKSVKAYLKGRSQLVLFDDLSRRSGRAFIAPVFTFPTDDGFMLTLPFGAATDRCRN